MPTDRKQVYNVIDGERRYQDLQRQLHQDGRPYCVGHYLTMLAHQLHEAQAAYAKKSNDEPALDEIRKIAATAVQCMEQHGAIQRTQW